MTEKCIDYPEWEINREARVKQALAPIEALGLILKEFPSLGVAHDFMADAGTILVALYERAFLMLDQTENPSQGGCDNA